MVCCGGGNERSGFSALDLKDYNYWSVKLYWDMEPYIRQKLQHFWSFLLDFCNISVYVLSLQDILTFQHGIFSKIMEIFCSVLVPPNGLVVYCGTIVTDEGKEKKVNIDFEPFRPINTSLYLCDNKFHTEVSGSRLAYYTRQDWRTGDLTTRI